MLVAGEHAHLAHQWPVIGLASGMLAAGGGGGRGAGHVLVLPRELPPLPDVAGDSAPVPLFDYGEAGAWERAEDAGEGEVDGAVREQEAARAEEVQQLSRQLREHPVLTGLQRLGCPVVHPALSHVLPRPDPADLARHALIALGAAHARAPDAGAGAGAAGEGAEALSARERRAVFRFMACHLLQGRFRASGCAVCWCAKARAPTRE